MSVCRTLTAQDVGTVMKLGSKLSAQHSNQQSRTATQDWYVLREMQAALRESLNAGLLKCHDLSRQLNLVDPDDLMVEVHCAFDPLQESAIQDCFSDAFHSAKAQIQNAGGEPIFARDVMPSGAAKT
jgi:hypothetical protein